jgi:hypothetical protein
VPTFLPRRCSATRPAQAVDALGNYPALARQLVDVIATVARADVAIAKANAHLPAAEKVVAPEQLVRGLPGEPFVPLALASTITLPGFLPGEPEWWTPTGNDSAVAGQLGTDGDEVLAAATEALVATRGIVTTAAEAAVA